MDKPTRSAIEKATQRARKLLEEDFAAQLDGTFDVARSGHIAPKAGAHLSVAQVNQRDRIVATLSHKCAAGASAVEAVTGYLRDAAFTALNRFAALKMLEARGLVRECVSKGEKSSGYIEFCGMAQGVGTLPDGAGYRLYLECVFDELSTEVKVLFDRRDAASVLWPKRTTFDDVLALLNAAELASVWNEDETIGWVYQYFNTGDERRQMRDESQAPRNSRELAVRNQFFTPRYVVQFLTDNTLGRTWYQMREGRTALAEQCAYLVRDEGITTRRDPKDPRDLKVLDPACGSGHFLLYAFDLLLVIYQEAWSDEAAAVSATTGRSLRDDYPDLAALHRAIPALVLRHNLHGVDIDPRAAQIAALALWLRAQRAFKDLGVAAAARAPITRTHIVVAEPMPGDDAMVRGFADGLRPPFLRDLFVRMVDEMRLAGELGTLLRVEKAIADALRKAREQFVAQQRGLTTGFLPGLAPVPRQGELDLTGIDDDRFFHEAEERIVEALRKFSESSAGAAGVRRRLFSGDSTQGIALIDLLRTKFDVVLMNPPFGSASSRTEGLLKDWYRVWTRNLACAFVERIAELRSTRGLVGVVVDRTVNEKSTYEGFRREFLLGSEVAIQLVADLGWEVLDANVEVSTFVLGSCEGSQLAAGIDAREERDKAGLLLRNGGSVTVSIESMRRLPNAVIGYFFPSFAVSLFGHLPSLKDSGFLFFEGHTLQSDRYFRLSWERALRADPCWLFNGSPYSRFAFPFHGVLSFNATSIYEADDSAVLRNPDLHGKFGICFGKRGEFVDAQILPAQFTSTVEGKACICPSTDDALALLALMNSDLFQSVINLYTGQHKYGGYVELFPYAGPVMLSRAADIAKSIHDEKHTIYGILETSPGFTGLDKLDSRAIAQQAADSLRRINNWEDELNHAVLAAYGANGADAIEFIARSCEGRPKGALPFHVDNPAWCAQLIVHYAVGLAFARYPAKDSSLTVSADNLLAGVAVPWSASDIDEGEDLLVEDAGHRCDIVRRIEDAVPSAELAVLKESNGVGSVRDFVRNHLFDFHCELYSSSGRVAPIYWQIATPTASYSVWIYAHRVTSDTFFRIQNDVIAKKLSHEESQLTSLIQAAGPAPDKGQRKELDALETFVGELRAMLDEVKRVAPLWRPDLDDGVVLTMAPLWRLVPQHRAWQKELKTAWDALCAGTHDWAHVAMHLWPERVVPACVTDRSFAIAHGLEDALVGAMLRREVAASRDALRHDLPGRRSPRVTRAAIRARRRASLLARALRRQGRSRQGLVDLPRGGSARGCEGRLRALAIAGDGEGAHRPRAGARSRDRARRGAPRRDGEPQGRPQEGAA